MHGSDFSAPCKAFNYACNHCHRNSQIDSSKPCRNNRDAHVAFATPGDEEQVAMTECIHAAANEVLACDRSVDIGRSRLTGTMGVWPPHSSGSRPTSLSPCFTLSTFAPSLSICAPHRCAQDSSPLWRDRLAQIVSNSGSRRNTVRSPPHRAVSTP